MACCNCCCYKQKADPQGEDRSRLNLNGSRHISRSATELRPTNGSPGHHTGNPVIHHRHHHHASVAQRTQSFFATLKNRWSRSRSKERKKTIKDAVFNAESTRNSSAAAVVESDYAADYSSEHSPSSSTTQSPARHYLLNHPDSPLARGSRDRGTSHEGSPSRCSTGSGRVTRQPSQHNQNDGKTNDEQRSNVGGSSSTLHTVPLVHDEEARRREIALRQHAFFQLRVHLRCGSNLVAMDRGGSSDPYVKIKCAGRLLYKSRTVQRDLNPVWDESVTLPIEDPFQPLTIKVFDYDWGLQDDFMGSTLLHLTQLELGVAQDIVLELLDPARPKQQLGNIYLTATLWPKNQQEKEQYFQRNTRLSDVNKRLKSQIWSSVVTIVLVEAKNLSPMDTEGLSDPFVKFRLGTEKYKSKVVHKTLSPVWLEQFDLHLYEDVGFGQELEVTVWDRDKSRDDLMGRAVINLAALEREKTHRLWCDLDENAGSVFLLLTISGTTASETISDLAAHEETAQERALILQRYSILNTFQRPRDVGHLTVKVFKAQGLAAADLGGKSDPFCVLELVNARLQTQTEYKTLAPNWQKIFTFNVKDINSVLEVTVYDEDRDHKVEFLGKVAIPLLRIRNGDKRWYALKDKKLRGRAKGNSPQILLELSVVWNPLRACARTLNPQERKYMEPEVRFKRQVFLKNVLRLKAIIVFFIDNSKYVQSCFEWESTPRSIVAFALFIFLCNYFEPYMIPTAALLIFLKYYVVALVTGWPTYHPSGTYHSVQDCIDGGDDGPSTPGAYDDDEDDDDKDKEEKKSLKERLQAIQEVTQTVQNSIGYIASLGESIKNTFNFTVPYLSYLAMILALGGAIVLYFVPIRYLIMIWGINKFLRKILRPHTVPNNELLDLLSRVPDDEDLLSYRELRPVPTPDCDKGGMSSGSTGSSGRKDQRRKHKAA